ncbi:MAG: transglycosylase SLT domain-containing protein [Betaproteobacteria bacterium]|nr:transglycosylase SLT domain-containing protein [Betaproteobacteria bacterium]
MTSLRPTRGAVPRPPGRPARLARRAAAALLLATQLASGSAWAGAQRQEALSDAVRLALAAQISDEAPPVPHFHDPGKLVRYLLWLATESSRLRKRIPDMNARHALLRTIWYEATRAGLQPSLVLGLIQVESGFNKYAISPVGALGLMQVMPFWTRQIGNGDKMALFRMRVNLRYGCVILRHYLDEEHGSLFYALGRYNGSRGRAAYPDAVLAASRQWQVRAPLLAEALPARPASAPR